MTHPSRPDLRYIFHTINLASGVAYLFYDLRFHPVEHASKDRLARLPDDHKDGCRYQQPHDGVGQRVAYPHPHSPGQHGQARPAVGPGVVAVGHERRAAYLPADPDAEHGHSLVTQKADHGSHGYGPEHPYGLRVDEPLHGLVPGNNSAEQDDEH